jgi:hypothetical protein
MITSLHQCQQKTLTIIYLAEKNFTAQFKHHEIIIGKAFMAALIRYSAGEQPVMSHKTITPKVQI